MDRKANHLENQTSPYLLQHVYNPVDWYPWCEEAFARARAEDKPIFLSIGYSTCHWCHVMAHESFEDEQVAELLNAHYIAIKVDKEERPDIDSIYMEVCQAFTGSGGWPTTVLMTAEQKPFFAGTYFPKHARMGQMGLMELLDAIAEQWQSNRQLLLDSAEEMLEYLRNQAQPSAEQGDVAAASEEEASEVLIHRAVNSFKRRHDAKNGGFGRAPKFPMPHNLMFLMRFFERSGDEEVLEIVDKTLDQMYRGGLFDHIGGGFCRYSTDAYFLVPHFEKMLYDNALLIEAYSKAYQLAGREIYREIATRTADYVLREMTDGEGAFYCAQDADSEGEEGKYYLFTPVELAEVLGEDGAKAFGAVYDISEEGNFEGKNILNLLRAEDAVWEQAAGEWVAERNVLYHYRRQRVELHKDDKILTAWNALMIAGLCSLYRVTGEERFLAAARRAQDSIQRMLCEGDVLYVSCREGHRSGEGYLEDYGYEIYALLALYGATFEKAYLRQAERFVEKVERDFHDETGGGYYLTGVNTEQLLLRPKQVSDGALYSGNSVMAYSLWQLYYLTAKEAYRDMARRQTAFVREAAGEFPAGYAMTLRALLDGQMPPDKLVVVCDRTSGIGLTPCEVPLDMVVRIEEEESEEYMLRNGRTTYYVCKGFACQPPTNEIKYNVGREKARLTQGIFDKLPNSL